MGCGREEDVADAISDEIGWCVNGSIMKFNLKETLSNVNDPQTTY